MASKWSMQTHAPKRKPSIVLICGFTYLAVASLVLLIRRHDRTSDLVAYGYIMVLSAPASIILICQRIAYRRHTDKTSSES